MAGLDIVAGSLGIVGVGQQLLQSVLKIRDFCRDVRDAPAELQDTLLSIESMGRTLIRLGEIDTTSMDGGMNEDILQGTLDLCKGAVDRVATLSLELQLETRRAKYLGSIKTVLMRREAKALLAKLDRSKIDLHIAYSMYVDARRKAEHEIIRKCLEEERQSRALTAGSRRTLTMPVTVDEGNAATCQAYDEIRCLTKRRRSVHNTATTTEVRIQLPLWLCQYAWDVALQRACGRFTISLKMLMILPGYHPARYMFVRGDVDGIRELLDKRELSLHVEFEGDAGFTLAAIWGHTSLVQFMLDSGLGSADVLPPALIPRYLFTWFDESEGLEYSRAHAQVLLQEWEGEEDPYLGALAKLPMTWTLEERLTVLKTMVSCIRPKMFWELSGIEQADPELFVTRGPGQSTLLHIVARQLFWDSTFPYRVDSGSSVDICMGHVELCAKRTANLHALNQRGETAFMVLLEDVSIHAHDVYTHVLSIRRWAECLYRAGVDLTCYGNVETKLIQSDERLSQSLKERGFSCLTYGARPTDWRWWYLHPGDSYAGVFWAMVEHEEQCIPGAWAWEE